MLLTVCFINTFWTYPNTPTSRRSSTESDGASLVSTEQITQIGAELGRAFPAHDQLSWLTKEGYKANKDKDLYLFESPKGLLYVKVPKAASSTTASVIYRISHNHGHCDIQAEHMAGKFYSNCDKKAFFLLGSIREPAKRAISRIFFHQVSQNKKEPSDKNVLKWLRTTHEQYGAVSEGQGGFQLRYLALDPIEPGSAWSADAPEAVNNTDQIHRNVQQIIEQYDFLIVVERMDELLVALQMLLGVDIGDMLALDSKVQGAYVYSGITCFKSVKAQVSPLVKEYISSNTWYAQNYGDYVLHAASNTSLDRTIEALGRERVEEGVKELRRLKSLANEKCASRAVYPCSKEGKRQLGKSSKSCYMYSKDFGCGYQCIDEILQSNATSLL